MERLLQLAKPESMQISRVEIVTDIYESNGKFHPGAALVGVAGRARGEKICILSSYKQKL